MISFSEWLFLYAIHLTEDDPVNRMARACYQDLNWPTGMSSFEELWAYLSSTGRGDEQWRYTSMLAWNDYKKFLLTQPS